MTRTLPRMAARRPGAGMRDHAQQALRGCKVLPWAPAQYVAVKAPRTQKCTDSQGLTPHISATLHCL